MPMSLLELKAKLQTIYRSQSFMPALIEGASLRDRPLQQSFATHYITSKLTLRDDNGNIHNLAIRALFSYLGDSHTVVAHKLLITGDAGVGKTTLMHYIAHEWGRAEQGLWNKQFEYVFKVNLKTLLKSNWTSICAGD